MQHILNLFGVNQLLDQVSINKGLLFPVEFLLKEYLRSDDIIDKCLKWLNKELDENDWDYRIIVISNIQLNKKHSEGYVRKVVFVFRNETDAIQFKLMWG